jgi:hypothetical protein
LWVGNPQLEPKVRSNALKKRCVRSAFERTSSVVVVGF